MGRTVRTETIVLWLCVSFFAIAGLAPIAIMVFDSFRQSGRYSLDYYRELIAAARFWPLLGNSASALTRNDRPVLARNVGLPLI